MFIVKTLITITQQSTATYSDRKGTFTFNFVNEFEATDSWEDFTNEAIIKIPKNIYYLDANGKKVNLGNTMTNLGGFSDNPPAFLKGDKVTIKAGYDNNIKPIFEGYITEVDIKTPFTLHCEDNFWILKQTPAPDHVFSGSKYNVESMIQEMLQGTGFEVKEITDNGTKTAIGDFRAQNETVAQVLKRLRNDFHFESYFNGDQLRIGSQVYVESDAKFYTFIFQNNIISDQLTYQRCDDLVLSAIAYSVNKTNITETTKDGHSKTKNGRLEVLVGLKDNKPTSEIRGPGQKDFPQNTVGERRTLYFWNVTNAKDLIDLAQKELKKYYYTGLKGSFTTFGAPQCVMGDNAIILDAVLPERSGIYKIKSVKYSVSVDSGARQEIELDYQIQRLNLTPEQIRDVINTGKISPYVKIH